MNFKQKIKSIIGQRSINTLHGIKAFAFSIIKGRPANKMRVIGITGTKGKTTTTMVLGRMMNLSGIKTGFISSANIYTGNGESQANNISKLKTIRQKIADYR